MVLARFAETLASLVCFLSLGIVTAVAAIIGRTRDQRANEALLLLPLHRSSLATGTALGSFPVVAVQLLAGIGVFVVVGTLPLPRLAIPAGVVVGGLAGTLLGALLLAAVASGLGVLAGAIGVGGDDAVAVGDFLAAPYLALGLVLFVAPELEASVPLLLTPVLGGALLVRDALLGTATPANAALVAGSSLVATAVLVRLAAWRLGDDRQVLRAVA
ncbi:MAG: hypothetical protein U5R31_01625 [Acidimicrobiia bacterium]|nr:hypothetical protein [Acidimicrobiia bacterium]